MNIYLCAQFKEQALMLVWAEKLINSGHTITSRWLGAKEEGTNSKIAKDAADIDLDDIDKSEIVISHTLNRGDLYTGGGRHIEYGYALAKGKRLINIGGFESVFHSLADTVSSIEEAIELLK